jgi:twitching motility two-component system response regulator PilG
VVIEEPKAVAQQASTRDLRVVVIDDEPDAVMTLLELLREQGYRAEGFGGGAQALQAIPALDPDVIICDIAMPAPNGWDVAKQVRATRGREKRPLMIAISGRYTKGADRVLAQISGFNFFLTKPYDPQVLLALVEKERP